MFGRPSWRRAIATRQSGPGSIDRPASPPQVSATDPATPALGGAGVRAGRSIRIRRDLAPIVSRRLASRRAFARARRPDRPAVARWPTPSAGSSLVGPTPAAMDKARHRARLTRPRRRARYPSRMRLSSLFFTTPARRPVRCRDAVASIAASSRLCPPARFGDLLAAAARVPRQQARRTGHPRGDGSDRLPGDGDAGRPPGRRLEGQRPL